MNEDYDYNEQINNLSRRLRQAKRRKPIDFGNWLLDKCKIYRKKKNGDIIQKNGKKSKRRVRTLKELTDNYAILPRDKYNSMKTYANDWYSEHQMNQQNIGGQQPR